VSPCKLNSVYHRPVFHPDANVRPTDDIADELLIKSANSKKGTNLECYFYSLILHMCKHIASPIGQILSQYRFAQRKIKVKFPIEQTTKGQKVSRVIALLFR
jgi:hypothetical protein